MSSKDYSELFDEVIESRKDEVIEKLQELLRIRSVEGEPKEGMPFGEGVAQSLDYTLDLCRKLGLETTNIDNKFGYCEYGEGEDLLGILVHLDVVPEGEGWTYPPYAAEIHDGKIYARGAIDDKGPAISVIYALYIVKELGIKLNKRVRIIFGTNEETDWKCMDCYRKTCESPTMGFTPDGGFPVINGEKGIVTYNISRDFHNDGKIYITEFSGGQRENMVPDRAVIELFFSDNFLDYIRTIQKEIKDTDFEAKRNGVKLRIISKGISTHGSTPEFGINAISKLMVLLNNIIDRDCELKRFLNEYVEKIGMEYNGESLGVDFSDKESGPLTFNVGTAKFENGVIDLGVNIRYPVTVNKDDIKSGIEANYDGVRVTETDYKKPIFIPTDDPFIQTLLEVYKESTGDYDAEPMVIGGGTYARAFDNVVAFGAVFPNQEMLAHEKDEYISVDHMMKLVEIYSKAIVKLAAENQ